MDMIKEELSKEMGGAEDGDADSSGSVA